MKVLAYSPSCEAYAECKTKNGAKHYDLTGDIVSMQVTRQSMGSSTFSVVLQNKDWKYNGVFTPMDKIVLYATKQDRHKLLSGFITECDVFSLYQKDFTIKGRCTLYRIEQLYWDPGITQSAWLLGEARTTNKKWGGYAQTIYDLLMKVGSWPEENIYIGDLPEDAIEFAKNMYLANKESSDELKNMANEFYEVLRTHGPKASGLVSVDGNGGTVGTGGDPNGAKYFQVQKNGVNCGATAFTVALNMILGLQGDGAFDNLSVWASSAFGSDSTVNLPSKGSQFIADNGLSSRVAFYDPGWELTSPSQIREELQAGHLVVVSSGGSSQFLRTDGSSATYPGGHFIMFYRYDNGTYYCNDSSSSLGGGVGYSEDALSQWISGRGYHTPCIMAKK